MTAQFGRSARFHFGATLVFDSILGTGYRIAFTYQKTIRPEPNTAEIQIYNLPPADRARISYEITTAALGILKSSTQAALFAGYGPNPEQVISGDVLGATHKHEGPDWITTIRLGHKGFTDGDVCASFLGSVPYGDLLQLAGAQMDLDTSNASAELAKAVPGIRRVSAASGGLYALPARELADEAAGALGLSWSAQDGRMQLIPEGTFTADDAIVISPATGLLEDPIASEFDRYEVRFLLNPQAYPGRQVVLRDERDTAIGAGVFRVDKASGTGDTGGGDWSIVALLRPANVLTGAV